MIEWKNNLSHLSVQPNKNISYWLTKPKRLTQTLGQHCNQLDLKVLQQRKITNKDLNLTHSDSQPIDESYIFFREILLIADLRPACYAQVHIPEITYTQFKTSFDNLEHQPIGETLLYHRKNVQRSEFQYAYLEPFSNILIEPIHRAVSSMGDLMNKPAWVRRSTFKVEGYPLTIIEVFLDGTPSYNNTIF